ncbi:MAG: hypothetical protein HDT44_06230 [Ruminococcaceae bacterium]|nr:hypothetical protein [Oscillospiraceae bacterium]
MTLKESVERAFGEDGHSLIIQFLLDEELADCTDDGERWRTLFEKCDRFEKGHLLWSEETYIDGINGWHLSIRAGRFVPPGHTDDIRAYLYYTSLLMLLRYDYYDTPDSRQEVIDRHTNSTQWKDSYSCGFDIEFYLESGYWELTRSELLEELGGFWRTSWGKWQKYQDDRTNNPEYVKAMKVNYPKFKKILDRLDNEIGGCQAARMNRHGGDETVWYFVKTEDGFFVIYISDAM